MKKLLDIDKQYNTDFANKISQMPFSEFVGYVSMNSDAYFSQYEFLKSQFEDYKSGSSRYPIDKNLITSFLKGEGTDRVSDLVEFSVDFLTTLYQRSDAEDIIDDVLDIANRLQETLDWREENKDALIAYLKAHYKRL